MIRLANISDIDEIMDIYKISKEIMDGIGNNTQWNNGYPNKEMIIEDIKNKNSYLVYDNDSIVGVFSFIIGEDETYSYIEDGSFLSIVNMVLFIDLVVMVEEVEYLRNVLIFVYLKLII